MIYKKVAKAGKDIKKLFPKAKKVKRTVKKKAKSIKKASVKAAKSAKRATKRNPVLTTAVVAGGTGAAIGMQGGKRREQGKTRKQYYFGGK
jgi:ornithine carbamoyltransferase